MKKTLVLLIISAVTLAALAGVSYGQGATSYNIQSRPTANWWTGSTRDIGWGWAKEIDNLVAAGGGITIGTGSVFYVDSGVTNEGDGSSWSNATDTLDEAINLCAANNGDVIYVAPGHGESGSAADLWDADVAGITIIGLRNGTDMPTFTFADTDTTVAIGAANVEIRNLRFLAGISEVVTGISVEAAADDCIIRNCVFPEPTTSSFEFDKSIVVATGADRLLVTGCMFLSADEVGATNAIDLDTGVQNGTMIVGNYIYGEYAEGAIHSDQVDLDVCVWGNAVSNLTTGQHGIEFAAAALGTYGNNYVYTDAEATSIDPGSLKATAPNWIVTAIDASPVMFPAPDDTAQNFIGVDDADNAADTSNVVANADGSILERLEQVDTDTSAILVDTGTTIPATITTAQNDLDIITGATGANLLAATQASIDAIEVDTGTTIPATITTAQADLDIITGATGANLLAATQASIDAIEADTDTISGIALPAAPIADSLAAFIASGGTALGTELADSKSIVDAIGTDGTTPADTATGIAGMIGVDNADNAMATSAVVADADGSVYERLEQIQEAVNPGTGTSLAATESLADILYAGNGVATFPAAASAANGISIAEVVRFVEQGSPPQYDRDNYFTVDANMASATWNTAAAHEIATVTGAVRVRIMCQVTETFTDAADGATMALGIEGNTAALIGSTSAGGSGAANQLDAGELWVDATPADLGTALITSAAGSAWIDAVVIGGYDIGYTIGGEAMTDGTITFHIWWEALDSTGAVAVGAGGAL